MNEIQRSLDGTDRRLPHPGPLPEGEEDVASSPPEGDLLDDPRVMAIVGEYQAELDLGRTPDRQSYVDRYPELADAVEQCLGGLDLVRAAAVRSSSSGAFRPVASEPAPKALGDFQIVRELGRGGMGVVYEAVQLSLGRRVALKVLPFAATFDARQLQRFKNEAQAAALLHHTNIVPVYAVGCERGVHFYAMQLIEGHSLALLIRQLREQAGLAPSQTNEKSAVVASGGQATDPYLGGVVPLAPAGQEPLRSTAAASLSLTARAPRGGDNYFQKAARLILQAAEALEHAHQLGIVHRDIKPANLMVNTSGTLWVTDFGLAQFQADAGLTRTGDVVGTFRYMSPEQATGQRTAVDQRADIYSLGATFYELLTLQPVFSGESRHELLHQILHEEPAPPRQINRSIPFELETIVLKALRKAPAERYAAAADFAEDLRRFLDNRPILARRPTPVDRLRKWLRRHPSVVVTGVLLLAVCLVGLLVNNRMIATEQEKTAAALAREEERANEAEDLFRQARQAVDFLVEVSEEELADSLEMMNTRRRVLQTALVFYQDFIDERRGDAASQADLTAVEGRVKGILHELELLGRRLQFRLLDNRRVLEEVDIAEQQREELSALWQTWDEERAMLGRLREMADEDDRRRQFVALAEQRERALADILTAEQLARLRQLALQSQGLGAFKMPEVASALELTRQQRADIRRIERGLFRPPPREEPGRGEGRRTSHDRGRPREHDASRDRGPPREQDRRQMHERPDGGPPRDRDAPRRSDGRDWRGLALRRQEAMAQVLALFTEEQLSRWHELIGEPVDGLDEPPHGKPDDSNRKPGHPK